MKNIALFTLSILFVGSTFSCKNKNNEAPVIVLDEPAQNSTIAVNGVLHVEGTATDDEALHELNILITTAVDTIVNENPVVHGEAVKEFHVNQTITVAGTYFVQVSASDHEGEKATANRTVVVTP